MNFSSLFDTVGGWVSFGIEWAIFAGLFAALLAAVVLPINLLLRRWITAGQMGLLWGLVLARLLIPIAPSSFFSLQNAFNRLLAAETLPATAPAELEPINDTPNPSLSNAESRQPAAADTQDATWDWVGIAVPWVWSVGAVASLVWTLAPNWRFSRKIKGLPQSADVRLLGLWRACCREAGVRRSVPIVLCDAVAQPAVMGVFRMRLLLPTDTFGLTDDQLRMVMLHELAHIRRWDVAINWCMAFIRAVQWWNPIYWLAATRFRNLREQACDAFVLRRLSGQTGSDYGDLLLTLIARTPPRRWRVLLPAPMLGFILSSFRRRAISCRLRAIPRAAIVRGRWHTLAIAAATLLLAACGLTDAMSEASGDDDTPDSRRLHLTVVDTDVMESPQSFDQPFITREYDVGAALRGIAGNNRTLSDARKDFDNILLFEFKQRYAQKAKQTTGSPAPAPSKTTRPATVIDDGPFISWKLDGDRLQLTAPPSQHDHFTRGLRAWEQAGLAQISVECRFISMPRRLKPGTNIAWRYVAPFSSDTSEPPLPDDSSDHSQSRATAKVEEYVPVVYAILDPNQAKRIAHEAQRDAHSSILKAPKITLFTGQQASIADTMQRPFVVATREIAGSLGPTNEPRIVVADEGTKITLQPTLRADRSHIQFHSRLEMSCIEEVGLIQVDSHHPGAGPHTVQVPKLRRLRIDIATELDSGNSLLIGSIPDRFDERGKVADLFILLTPRVIPDSD